MHYTMKKIYKNPTVKVFAFEAEDLIATSLTSNGNNNGLDGTGWGGNASGNGNGGFEADTRRQGSPIWDSWSN